jgi:hypothetical protein
VLLLLIAAAGAVELSEDVLPAYLAADGAPFSVRCDPQQLDHRLTAGVPEIELVKIEPGGSLGTARVCRESWLPVGWSAVPTECTWLECEVALSVPYKIIEGASRTCSRVREAQPEVVQQALKDRWPTHPDHCREDLELGPHFAIAAAQPVFPGSQEVYGVWNTFGDLSGYIVDGQHVPTRLGDLGAVPVLSGEDYTLARLSGRQGWPMGDGELISLAVFRSEPNRVEGIFETTTSIYDVGWRVRDGWRYLLIGSQGRACRLNSVLEYECGECGDLGPRDAGEFLYLPYLRGYSVRASSQTAAGSDPCYTFGPENLSDDLLGTSWQEGVPGDGVGEWVEFTFAEPVNLQHLEIATGFQRKDPQLGDLFSANGRVTALRVQVNGEQQATLLKIEDKAGLQKLGLEARGVRTLRLTIAEVASGDRWSDTAISEIYFMAAL